MKNILKYNYILNKTNLDFFEVLKRRSQLCDEDPFANVGCEKLCKEIITPVLNLNFELKKEDLEIMTFVIIDELNFDGKIDLLEELVNIEYIYISGINGIGKTKDLTVLQNLKKIRYLDIHNCLIDNLTPLNKLTEIEYLLLRNNPLITIKPICHFKKLKKIEISYQLDYRIEEYFTYNENEFEELKSNSENCEMKFTAFNSKLNEYYTKVL